MNGFADRSASAPGSVEASSGVADDLHGPRPARSTGMTINSSTDPRPHAQADIAIAPPTTSDTEPEVGVPPATSEPDLESRIKVRRTELIATLHELRADKRIEAREAGDKLRAKLSELAHILKWGVVGDWASTGDQVKHKLEHWLTETARQSPTQDISAGTGQS